MARLAARFPTPRPTPAAGTRRSRRTVLRGWLAAVAAVPAQLTTQFRILGLQHAQPVDQLPHHRHDRMAGQHGVGAEMGNAVGEGRSGQGGEPAQCGTDRTRTPTPSDTRQGLRPSAPGVAG